MVCHGCQRDDHEKCYDRQHQTDYRSCTCLHRSEKEMLAKDESSGDPTDC